MYVLLKFLFAQTGIVQSDRGMAGFGFIDTANHNNNDNITTCYKRVHILAKAKIN